MHKNPRNKKKIKACSSKGLWVPQEIDELK